uniref:Neural proliferation differentiation and control protein n=1 Tax=Rhodnius prolixus TaxID=13249 RepID=T1HA33_RHOPR
MDRVGAWRTDEVEGYPQYEERWMQDYLSQMMSGRLQAAQGAVGLTGGDGGSEDEWLPPPPRHRPQYKPIAPMFTYNAVNRPVDPSVPQFAVPPSDGRFFETVETATIPPIEEFSRKENPSLGEHTMMVNNVQPEDTSEDDNMVYKTPLIDFDSTKENILLIALVVGSSVVAVSGIALLIYGFVRLQRNAKAAADVEYPAYGVTGPNKEATPTGDRRLAHSAQMYHYQLTKQQIIAMERLLSRGERRGSISEADSDDENEEGDYTVYECPGLAPTGEMEVKNPLFQDDPTPATTALSEPSAATLQSEPDLTSSKEQQQQQQPSTNDNQ